MMYEISRIEGILENIDACLQGIDKYAGLDGCYGDKAVAQVLLLKAMDEVKTARVLATKNREKILELEHDID